MKHKWQIGDKVIFRTAYPTKCSRRFPDHKPGDTYHPQPCCHTKVGPFEGYVVKTAVAIMDNYRFFRGYKGSSFSYYNDEEPASAIGDKEFVLYISESVRHNPVIVRLCDVIEVNGEKA